MTYAEVLLPLAVSSSFTYAVPERLESKIGIGHRVIVPLGIKNKFYTGIVLSLTSVKPTGDYELKDVSEVLDPFSVVIPPQLRLWNWIAEYYLCYPGEVYKAAVPSGLKIESDTVIEVAPDDSAQPGLQSVSERESIMLSTLQAKGRLTVKELSKLTGFKNAGQLVSTAIDKGLVMVSEKLQEKYRTKKETFVRFATSFSPDKIEEYYASTKGAPKQEKLLTAIISEIVRQRKNGLPEEVRRKTLLEMKDAGASVLDALVKKEVLVQYRKDVNRFMFEGKVSGRLPELTAAQSAAFDSIVNQFTQKAVVLLRGVTSSGKTEIYQHLIKKVLDEGSQVLMLVPEIALTTQLTTRMQAIFGNKVVIYHSKFSDADRVEIWLDMVQKKKPCLVIGARSSVFLPFFNLKLIIVDEEHESSYKQFDPAPRYNARDVAVVLASLHGAKTLLGSATPAIETYHKALGGKFGLVELLERYNNVPQPPIELIDLTDNYKRGSMAGAFSLKALHDIKQSFEKGKQSIVFQNRRGFAPVARCKMCAWSPKCDQCDVSLTYHKNINSLVCHYCGNIYALPKLCPQCGEPTVEIHGFGTERLEEEIVMRIPEAKIARMDLDTTRNKDSYSNIIDDFSKHKNDILVGTQMVTKGLDFGDVSNVLVVNTDSLINFPDFRARERAFNMLEQVSGRAGRRGDTEGKVIFQTYDPQQRIFYHLKRHDYRGFFDEEIQERKKYSYPPFTRIIIIYIKHRDVHEVQNLSLKYVNILRMSLGNRVYGPEEPSVSRVQNLYIRTIMLKLEPNTSLKKLKDYLREVYVYMHDHMSMKSATVYYDVDPG